MDETARPAGWGAWGLTLACLGLVGTLTATAVLDHRSLSYFLSAYSFPVVFALAFPLTGAIVASRHPRNPVGWLMILAPLFSILSAATDAYARHALVTSPGAWPAGDVASWVSAWSWAPFLGAASLLLLLLPDGRPASGRWRWVIYATAAQFTLLTIGFMATWPLRGPRLLGETEQIPDLPAITKVAIVSGFLVVPLILAGAASIVLRFVRSRGEERQQLKWITLGVVVLGVEAVVSLVFSGGLPTIVDVIAIVPLAAAIGIAILRYRLYDIDIVLNKAVVYGSMGAFITTVYVAVVVGIGRAVGSDRNLALSILATALVAAGFQPVREWVQRLANRLVYGERATPYEVLSEFSTGMAATMATEELLPRIARAVAEGVGAARADVWLRVGAELVREVTWPGGNGPTRLAIPVADGEGPAIVPDVDATVEVRHRGELLGVIGVRKTAGEGITPAEAKLLEDLGSQAGLVLRNVRLVEELRTSRQRLVTAQNEERRRLERDLHDGAQQRLVAIAVAMRLAGGMLDPVSDAALGERLATASEQLARALAELRDFARGIHPTILTELGLGPALESLAERSPVPATLQTEPTHRLPGPVEAAAYFLVSEALANAAKHAKATLVSIRAVVEDGVLVIEVADDGLGGAALDDGSGLRGLHDRVAAVDGILEVISPPGEGTRLSARIPVPLLAEATT